MFILIIITKVLKIQFCGLKKIIHITYFNVLICIILCYNVFQIIVIHYPFLST